MRFDKICNINWESIIVLSYLSMLRYWNTCHCGNVDELLWTFQLTRHSVTWRSTRWVSPSSCLENPGPEKPSPPSISWSIWPSPGALTSTSSSRGYSSVSFLQDFYYPSTCTTIQNESSYHEILWIIMYQLLVSRTRYQSMHALSLNSKSTVGGLWECQNCQEQQQ